MHGAPEAPPALDVLRRTLYPLFCVDGRGIRRVGHGDVLGALLDVFGPGGRAGRVCAVFVQQVSRGFYSAIFRVLMLSLYSSFVRSFE